MPVEMYVLKINYQAATWGVGEYKTVDSVIAIPLTSFIT